MHIDLALIEDRSTWFSLEILEEDWPWIFAKDRETALVQVAVRRGTGRQQNESHDRPDTHRQSRERCSSEQTHDPRPLCSWNCLVTWKWNRILMEVTGHDETGSALKNKLPTTGVFGRLSSGCPGRGETERPRVFDGFDPTLRIPVSAAGLVWEILPREQQRNVSREPSWVVSGQIDQPNSESERWMSA